MVTNCPNSKKIGMHSPFGPKFPIEFEAFFQKKLDWPTVQSTLDFATRDLSANLGISDLNQFDEPPPTPYLLMKKHSKCRHQRHAL